MGLLLVLRGEERCYFIVSKPSRRLYFRKETYLHCFNVPCASLLLIIEECIHLVDPFKKRTEGILVLAGTKQGFLECSLPKIDAENQLSAGLAHEHQDRWVGTERVLCVCIDVGRL